MKTSIRLFMVSLLLGFGIASAQDGTLDTSFGTNGKVITSFGNDVSAISALVLQTDQKIIAGGMVGFNSDQFALVRYNTDGSLDTTFGNGGKAITLFPGLIVHLTTMVLQPNGKIVAGGYLHTDFPDGIYQDQFALMRFNTNGALDPTFGLNGKVFTAIGTGTDKISSLAIQDDGKIVVGGESGYVGLPIGTSKFILARYTINGSLDMNFGFNGIVATALKTINSGHKIALQPDGKIVFSGMTLKLDLNNNYIQNPVVLRYNSDGSADTSFGLNGIVLINSGTDAKNIQIQQDGKILIEGDFSPTEGSFFSLVRLLADGSLDPNYGNGGFLLIPLPFSENVEAFIFQPDGKIVVSQAHGTGGCCSADIKVMRFLANGDLDTTFGINGNNGIVTLDFTNEASAVTSMVLQADGKIVLGGDSANQIHSDFALARLNSKFLSNADFNIEKNTLAVYPNPVNHSISLNFNLKDSDVLSIDLYDSSGRNIKTLIKEKAFQIGYNTQQLELPQTLASGIYFLNISDGKNTSTVKIIK